ncbi:hypothetical protein GCM10023238_37010 [Streptomyces heliomycini]
MNDSTRGAQAPAEAARFWENLYRGKDAVWKGDPNPVLAETAAQFTPPGRALDLGCGEGGDTVWLATHGWHVTAVDIAPTALQRLTQHAARAGVTARVSTQQHDLAATFPTGTFDLVSAQYLQTPYDLPRADILRQAAHALTPGGSSSSSTTARCAPGPGTPTPTPASPAHRRSSTNSPSTPIGSLPPAWHPPSARRPARTAGKQP